MRQMTGITLFMPFVSLPESSRESSSENLAKKERLELWTKKAIRISFCMASSGWKIPKMISKKVNKFLNQMIF